MKNIRRGLGKGLGMGYKNIVPIDSHIHSLSAKGVKTGYNPQEKPYKPFDMSKAGILLRQERLFDRWMKRYNSMKNVKVVLDKDPDSGEYYVRAENIENGEMIDEIAFGKKLPSFVEKWFADEIYAKGERKPTKCRKCGSTNIIGDDEIPYYCDDCGLVQSKKRAEEFDKKETEMIDEYLREEELYDTFAKGLKFSKLKKYMEDIENSGMIVDRELTGNAIAKKFGLSEWEGKQAVDYWENYKHTGKWGDFTWRENKTFDAKGKKKRHKTFYEQRKYDEEVHRFGYSPEVIEKAMNEPDDLYAKGEKEYKAGLIISPYGGKKFMWQVETDVDRLSPEIYEFENITAKNKQDAVDKLNQKYAQNPKYQNKLKKKPFGWGQGWW